MRDAGSMNYEASWKVSWFSLKSEIKCFSCLLIDKEIASVVCLKIGVGQFLVLRCLLQRDDAVCSREE
jgi:hypothetical protein